LRRVRDVVVEEASQTRGADTVAGVDIDKGEHVVEDLPGYVRLAFGG
jgi:hypothetical protein